MKFIILSFIRKVDLLQITLHLVAKTNRGFSSSYSRQMNWVRSGCGVTRCSHGPQRQLSVNRMGPFLESSDSRSVLCTYISISQQLRMNVLSFDTGSKKLEHACLVLNCKSWCPGSKKGQPINKLSVGSVCQSHGSVSLWSVWVITLPSATNGHLSECPCKILCILCLLCALAEVFYVFYVFYILHGVMTMDD